MSLSTSSSHLEETREIAQHDPSTPDERRRRRLNDSKLHRDLRRSLRKDDVQRADVKDLAQETLAQASRSAVLPDEDAACRQYVFGVARNVLSDHRSGQRRKLETGAVAFEEAAKSGTTGGEQDLERRLTIESLVAHLSEGRRRAFGWFLRNRAGVTYKALARENGLSLSETRRLAEDARERLSHGLHQLGIFAFVLLFLWASARDAVKPRQDVAKPRETPKVEKVDTRPAPSAAPASTPPQPLGQVTDPDSVYDGFEDTKTLSELRSRALAACDEMRWASCLRGLDMAKEVDAKGDQAPRIQAARAKATRALSGAEK